MIHIQIHFPRQLHEGDVVLMVLAFVVRMRNNQVDSVGDKKLEWVVRCRSDGPGLRIPYAERLGRLCGVKEVGMGR